MNAEIDYDRYSRQILLPEVGAAGQRRLGEAIVILTGDVTIAETARLYLEAAGTREVRFEHGGSHPSGEVVARLEIGESEIRVAVSRDGVVVDRGEHPSIASSRLDLKAAGMILATEIMKEILGMSRPPWRLDLS